MNDAIQREISGLIKIGEKLAADASVADSNLPQDRVQELVQIAARGGYLISKLYGPNSHYMDMFKVPLRDPSFKSMHSSWHGHVSEIVGILKGVEQDIDSGMLLNLRSLLQAEIFTDFLEMSEHLLAEGYQRCLGRIARRGSRRLPTENSGAAQNLDNRRQREAFDY